MPPTHPAPQTSGGALTCAPAPPRPTDFGWHDVGFHNNSEVHSPTIDALARDGLMLGRHYAYKVCCPTRSSFISGRLPSEDP